MKPGNIEAIKWGDPRLALPRPDAFPTYYAPKPNIPGLESEVRRICGDGNVKLAVAYGSVVSGVATPSSLLDILVIASNTWGFYEHLVSHNDVHLGTVNDPAVHALWAEKKTNFHLGNIHIEDRQQGIKLGVIGFREFKKHARGGRLDAMESGEGKGYEYLAGRIQKAKLALIFSDATPEEQKEIDMSINQARIDATRVAIGLMPRNCLYYFDLLARQYVRISYKTDKRIETEGKADSLYDNDPEGYENMLTPILDCLVELGEIEPVIVKGNVAYETRMALADDAIRNFIAKSKSHASRTNTQNTITMGLRNGLFYEIAKIRRVKGW